MNTGRPIIPVTEFELHAYVDGQLPVERQREVEAYLVDRPEEAQRVEAYRAQKRALRALFTPVLDEQVPPRLVQAAMPPPHGSPRWARQRLVAGLAIALVSGAAGWGLHGAMSAAGNGDAFHLALTMPAPEGIARVSTNAFARRAAVAHAVYSPDARRPVEVDAEHEDQLVAWLSKRMGTPMKPPHLQSQGYALEGGRLLPGGQGPVAQFMYRNALGSKLTLYVSNEIGDLDSAGASATKDKPNTGTAFRFAQEGPINVFYWVEGPFGYALSADADRAVLARVSAEVYRQLGAGR